MVCRHLADDLANELLSRVEKLIKRYGNFCHAPEAALELLCDVLPGRGASTSPIGR